MFINHTASYVKLPKGTCIFKITSNESQVWFLDVFGHTLLAFHIAKGTSEFKTAKHNVLGGADRNKTGYRTL